MCRNHSISKMFKTVVGSEGVASCHLVITFQQAFKGLPTPEIMTKKNQFW